MGFIKPDKNMNLNRFLAKPKTVRILLIIIDVLLYSVLKVIANFLFFDLSYIISKQTMPLGVKTLKHIFYVGPGKIKFYFFVIVSIVVLNLYLKYKFKVSYSEEYFNIGQKGKSRLTTKEEIIQQYKAVPEKDKEFPGRPGTIVAHFGGNLYLDTGIHNTLIIGITRSGKDEIYVFPSIDEYSRAEEKYSMVITDPKLESYKSSKETLENRGYKVALLNLDDALHSMGYNPLSLVIQLYKDGDAASAYSMARSLSYSIFYASGVEGEKIWQNTATDLFTALIIAVITDCIEMDSLENENRLEAYNEKLRRYGELSCSMQEKAKENWKKAVREGRDVIKDPNIKALPVDAPFVATKTYEKQISIFNIVVFFQDMNLKPHPEDMNKTMLDYYFENRDMYDMARLKYGTIAFAGDRTKGSIYTNMMSELGVFLDEKIAKMTAESSFNFEEIGFGERPIALFLGIPDYDKSPHFIASICIRQIYYILAKKATNVKGQACTTPVRFIVNEAGNIPVIEALDEILSVSNGRNIGFDLYVQSLQQLHKVYQENEKTIRDNCANKIYILSSDEDTNEQFSNMCGSETYIDVQRSGNKLSLDKNFMETPSDRPILRANEIGNFKEGECLVIRALKRKDNEGNDITPYPIFNSVENGMRFKYRYEYLTETFPNPKEIDLKDVNFESREEINLKERSINIKEILKYNQQRIIDRTIDIGSLVTSSKDAQNKEELNKKLQLKIGKQYEKLLGITNSTPLADVMAIIEATDLLTEDQKKEIRGNVF